ncbi:MAG: FliM/FliN family flagellar motor switch protein [Alphaproteobacteria bacterium]|nr:FliM/FliN family flagellar motor switch protein [Alphaproteobacteria bacterium]
MNNKSDISVSNLLSTEEITALLSGQQKKETNNILSFFTSSEYKKQSDIYTHRINKKLLEIYRVDANIIPTIPSFDNNDFFIAFSIENEEQSGKILLSKTFCSNIINLVLGGKTQGSDITRTPSTIKIIENIVKVFCETLISSNAKIIMYEQPYNISGICSENCFSFTLSEGGMFCLIFPEIKTKNDIQYENNNSLSVDIPLTISAVVKQSEVSLQNLSTWKIGDFLPMGIEKNAEISILCENKPLFKAVMGQKNNNIAVKITKKEK